MDLNYVRELYIGEGRDFAAGKVTEHAKLYHPYPENVVFDVEEVAYSFANHVNADSFEITIPENRRRDPDFIEGVEKFCERFAKMVRREKAFRGKISSVKVNF